MTTLLAILICCKLNLLAAKSQNIPVYCISTVLKYDPRPFNQTIIETRNPKEIWPDAPANLTIFAPAFDFTPYNLGVTLVTEAGMITTDYGKSISQLFSATGINR